MTVKINQTLDKIKLFKNFNHYINEKQNNFLKVFHGTKPKFVEDITKYGLVDKTGYNQNWFMVSTDIESALFHAHPDDKKDFVYVFEFNIPLVDNDMWRGYPYLWNGEKLKNTIWFALMQKLPKEFISKIYKISYDDWLIQKNKRF